MSAYTFCVGLVGAALRLGVIGHTDRGNYGQGLDVVWKAFDSAEIVTLETTG